METERDVQVEVCVQLFIQGTLPGPLDVTLSTVPGTAMGKPLVIEPYLLASVPVECNCVFLIVWGKETFERAQLRTTGKAWEPRPFLFSV